MCRELMHESVVMIVLYHFMCFSEFVPKEDTRFLLGYSVIVFVAAWFLLCLGWIAW